MAEQTIDLVSPLWKCEFMSLKSRYLVLMLALWLPLQGLAGSLLHCDASPEHTASDTPVSLHHQLNPLPVEELREHTRSASPGAGYHDVSHNSQSDPHGEHCQQCCQVCSTLIPSAFVSGSQPLTTLVIWPADNPDSIIPEPLFHPPQHLS